MSVTISANVLVRNEIKHVDAFVRNMIDACIDEVVFLDGGSSDGGSGYARWRDIPDRVYECSIGSNPKEVNINKVLMKWPVGI